MPDPTPDDATEPLFTATVTDFAPFGNEGVIPPADWIQLRNGDTPVSVHVGQEVDVYPAGVRPAAPTVTAAMFDGLYPEEMTYGQLADTINRLLSAQPTRETK